MLNARMELGDPDNIWAHLVDLVIHLAIEPVDDRRHGDDRRYADHHAKNGEKRTELIGPEGTEGHQDGVSDFTKC